MPGEGLEPTRIAPPDPKSGASANSATRALPVTYRVTIDNILTILREVIPLFTRVVDGNDNDLTTMRRRRR
jgi:hypothetical protein